MAGLEESIAGGGRIGAYSEDATGFGTVHWRTARDLVIRPRDVLDAYLTHGSTGGDRYARPLRFYVEICGVMTFFLFLAGGAADLLAEQMPAEMLADLISRSGKSRDAFLNDADGWLTFTTTPVLCLAYAAVLAPVIKLWTHCDWRCALRATFALLCASAVPMLALGPLPYMDGYQPLTSVIVFFLLLISFLRMGRGIWWVRRREAAGKGLLILVLITLATWIGMVPVFLIGALGGLYGS